MAKRPTASTGSDDDAASPRARGETTPSHPAADAPKMTPAAAVARHVEWLEYALGAARAEETVRAERVEKATKKNREKRTSRLAEVRDEVDELSALLVGIRDLQAKARGPRPGKPSTPRTRVASSRASTAPRRAAGSAPGG